MTPLTTRDIATPAVHRFSNCAGVIDLTGHRVRSLYPHEVRTIRLMADYECFPLWDSDADEYNIDPASLPIPVDLITRLLSWGDAFDATLNWEVPQESGFPDEASAASWLAEGRSLAEALRKHLTAPDWRIDYFHEDRNSISFVADPFHPPERRIGRFAAMRRRFRTARAPRS